MATQLTAYNDFTAGNRVFSDNLDADYMIATMAMFGSSDAAAIHLLNSSHDVYVRGTVMGDVIGIQLGDHSSANYGNGIHVSEGGAILGHEGVETYGGAPSSTRERSAAPTSRSRGPRPNRRWS